MSGQQGFTMIELIVGIVVAAILTAIAVPAFRDSNQNAQIRSTAAELATSFNHAKALAVSERRAVQVLTTATGWTLDSTAPNVEDQKQFTLGANVILLDNANAPVPVGTPLDFRISGLPAAGQVIVRICDTNRAGEEGRDITVSIAGRVTTARSQCP